LWKRIFFTSGYFVPVNGAAPAINRGAYLVQALSHCGECHTPRNFLGAPISSRFLAGGKDPAGKRIPNLTPTRLSKWSDADLKEFLLTGLTPDNDTANEAMAEVIRNTTSRLPSEDLTAMMAYLRSLPALPEEPR
jgi:mono/diheme cytochrome c family protein